MQWIELPVSNGQKQQPRAFPPAQATALTSALELALEVFRDEQGLLLDTLRSQLGKLSV